MSDGKPTEGFKTYLTLAKRFYESRKNQEVLKGRINILKICIQKSTDVGSNWNLNFYDTSRLLENFFENGIIEKRDITLEPLRKRLKILEALLDN